VSTPCTAAMISGWSSTTSKRAAISANRFLRRQTPSAPCAESSQQIPPTVTKSPERISSITHKY
jgi:hypothetical protein